jgi:protein-S-isoprenylcysteine O-methyltransferase Ste14
VSGNPIRLLLAVPVPWVFVGCYLLGAALERVGPGSIRSAEASISSTAGAVVFLVGAGIAGWSLWIFHRARTTTTPGERSKALITSGPYRFSRNPMYVGLTLAYLGEAGILKQIWPVVLLPLTLAYLNGIVIPLEESRLSEVFAGAYDEYRARVRRWL